MSDFCENCNPHSSYHTTAVGEYLVDIWFAEIYQMTLYVLEVNPCFQKAHHLFCMDLQPAADPYNVCMWIVQQVILENRASFIAVLLLYIQHCMDLQLAVDPYKKRVLFESMDWLPKTHIVSWHISANQISTKHSPTAVVWYEKWGLQFLQKSGTL